MLHLLNLACIKHTGQPLPSSATDANRWRYLTEDCYELDDNGEVIPKVKKLAILRGVPDIRPCVIHDDPETTQDCICFYQTHFVGYETVSLCLSV